MRTAPLILLASTLLLAGCDKVENPFTPGTGGGGTGGDGYIKRKVLLEDFTGHRCSFCPEATQIANGLVAQYGDDVIVVAIHATDFFAAPIPPLDDGYYDNDFRTAAGTAYIATWPVSGLPMGLVNRAPYDGGMMIGRNSWEPAVSSFIGDTALVGLSFGPVSFDPGSERIDVRLDILVNGDLQGREHYLTVYLMEDSIIGWQTDASQFPSEIPNYVHMHVLRDNMNGIWGQPVLTGNEALEQVVQVQLDPYFFNELPGVQWKPQHLTLVAYVYDYDSYEVVQAAKRKLLP